MATRSTIAIELEDGKVKQIYCHWDGYLSHNGAILMEHYSNPVKAEALINNGAISSLGSEIGEQHDFDERFANDDPRSEWTRFYGRDRGETGTEFNVFKDFNAYAKDHQYEEYEYIMRADGRWYVSEYGRDYRPLVDAMEDDDEC